MTDKFDNVPVEDDTKILFSTPTKFGEYDVLYQKWFWDGITAESLIFAKDDINNTTMADLEDEIKNSPLFNEKSQMTTSAKNEYAFFNFNFITDD